MNVNTNINTLELPDRLSLLLRMALEDLDKVRTMPERFLIYMERWHSPRGAVCGVCLAGSLLAMRTDVPDDYSVEYDEFGPSLRPKMSALNQLRIGFIQGAVEEFYAIDISGTEHQRDIEFSRVGRLVPNIDSEEDERFSEWRKSMDAVVEVLEHYGY